jgi:hypothetical protein
MDNHMRLLNIGLYTLLGLIIFSPLATAQTAPTATGYAGNGVFVQALKSSNPQIAGQAIIAQTTFRVQNGTAPAKYYDRAVSYNKSTYGGLGKRFLKGWGLQLGITAATLGIGYFLDYVTGDINQQPAQAPMNCNIVYQAINFNSASTKTCTFASAVSMAQAQCNTYAKTSTGNPAGYCDGFLSSPNVPLPTAGNTANHGQNVNIKISGTAYVQTTPFNVSIVNYAIPEAVPAIPAQDPLTDEQIGDVFINAPSPQTREAPLNNPSTGAVIRTSEIAQAEKTLYNEIAPELGKPTSTDNPVTPVDPDLQKPPAYDQLPQDISVDFPTFCTWASAVCDFIDWMKEPAEEPSDSGFIFADLIEEREIELDEYNSGLGSGSCPAPKSFSVLSAQLTYSYEPVCNMADVARPFVIIFAYITSIFILLGIRR